MSAQEADVVIPSDLINVGKLLDVLNQLIEKVNSQENTIQQLQAKMEAMDTRVASQEKRSYDDSTRAAVEGATTNQEDAGEAVEAATPVHSVAAPASPTQTAAPAESPLRDEEVRPHEEWDSDRRDDRKGEWWGWNDWSSGHDGDRSHQPTTGLHVASIRPLEEEKRGDDEGSRAAVEGATEHQKDDREAGEAALSVHSVAAPASPNQIAAPAESSLRNEEVRPHEERSTDRRDDRQGEWWGWSDWSSGHDGERSGGNYGAERWDSAAWQAAPSPSDTASAPAADDAAAPQSWSTWAPEHS